MDRKLPPRIDLGRNLNYTVCYVLQNNKMAGEGERLLNFIVPPFQRPPVWTNRQSVRFMESLIRGLPVGSYTFHLSYKNPKTDGWLIDGQQRMRAIAAYINDEFPVFGWTWSHLTEWDRRHFGNGLFAAYQLVDCGEQELIERYIAMNYSGTPHTVADKRKAKRAIKAAKESDRG